MPSVCDSTNWAMFVRTSDKGEPANIDLSRLRTDSVERKPGRSFTDPPCDEMAAADCTNRCMIALPCAVRFSARVFDTDAEGTATRSTRVASEERTTAKPNHGCNFWPGEHQYLL